MRRRHRRGSSRPHGAPTRSCSTGARGAKPRRAVPGPHRIRKLPATFSEPEVEQLLDRPTAPEPRRLRDRAMIELLYGSGLRASEACGLEIADVDADEGIVRVTGKGGKDRVVPLGGAATSALRRYLDEGRPALGATRGERLFVSVRGRPLGPSDVRRASVATLPRPASRSDRRMRSGTPSPRICSSWCRSS